MLWGPVEPTAQVRAAAALVRASAQAFAEANPYRARAVRADARRLLGQVAQTEEALLTGLAGATATLEPTTDAIGLVLATRIEGLARTADQLAALAESRTSPRFRDPLTPAFERQAQATGLVLDALAAGDLAGLGDALDDVRRCRQTLIESCLAATANPRLFSQNLLAASAAMRLEEAAEHAADLARVIARAGASGASGSPGLGRRRHEPA